MNTDLKNKQGDRFGNELTADQFMAEQAQHA
jgi:hypothetical protein